MSLSGNHLRVECRTIGEMIAVLQSLPPETVPFSYEHPPFTGCVVIGQEDGKVMIAGPGRASRRVACANPYRPTSDRMAVGE